MKEGDSIAVRILINLNASIKEIFEDVLKVMSENVSEENKIRNKIEKERKETSFSQTPTLNQFGIDLTKSAKERKDRSNYWKKRGNR